MAPDDIWEIETFRKGDPSNKPRKEHFASSLRESSSAVYPPSAFYFAVSFDLGSGIWDTSFKEVSGIGPEIETEDIVEGGENTYVHRLPKGVKHPKLILTRGIAKADSPLVEWCKAVLEYFRLPIVPKSLNVHLLNGNGEPIRNWSFNNAYPVKWEIESFNSTKNEVAIEKIEFSYSYSKRVETPTEK